MKKTTSLLIISTLVFMFSCKKDKDEPAPTTTYLTKQNIAGSGVFTYNYDAQNILQTVGFSSANEPGNPSYTYRVNARDASGRITDVLVDFINPTEEDVRLKYTFDAGGRITKEEGFHTTPTTALSYAYEYAYSSNQVTTTVLNNAGLPQYTEIITFNADGKNIAKLERFNITGTVTAAWVYSGYEDKKHFRSAYPLGYRTGINSANNYTTYTYTAATTSTVYTFAYEYNADGYVTKITNNNSGGVSTYEYVKK